MQELAAAERFHGRLRKRKVPAGTSEYLAAWILDDEDYGSGSDEEDEEEGGDQGMQDHPAAQVGACGSKYGSKDGSCLAATSQDSQQSGSNVAAQHSRAGPPRIIL